MRAPPPLRLIRAVSFTQRLAGWFRQPPPDLHHGLWLRPCRAVHTLGLRDAICVAFVDSEGRVLRVIPALKPWRFAACLRADSVVELRLGALDDEQGGIARLQAALRHGIPPIAQPG
ncbi:hypothetical protein ANT2_1919 [plant metagenome]|uniref:DUF192 domain-containing protein n=1 Tax=plant metagenome TaxID=1297885 RepID=A0A484SB71_9ZZZZ